MHRTTIYEILSYNLKDINTYETSTVQDWHSNSLLCQITSIENKFTVNTIPTLILNHIKDDIRFVNLLNKLSTFRYELHLVNQESLPVYSIPPTFYSQANTLFNTEAKYFTFIPPDYALYTYNKLLTALQTYLRIQGINKPYYLEPDTNYNKIRDILIKQCLQHENTIPSIISKLQNMPQPIEILYTLLNSTFRDEINYIIKLLHPDTIHNFQDYNL